MLKSLNGHDTISLVGKHPAVVAQLVEQYFRKVEVGGSNPPNGSKKPRLLTGFFDCPPIS